MTIIDLNCDLGENVIDEATELALLDSVTSANIACGGHAGDAATITRLASACVERNIGIGAHPSYPDRAGFGRDSLGLGPRDVEQFVASQLRDFLAAIKNVQGAMLSHVKPHGALYHDAMKNLDVADAIAHATKNIAPDSVLMGQADAAGLARWREQGFKVAAEAFADRRYERDGTLRSRRLPGALLESAADAAAQALSIARENRVTASDGTSIPVHAVTICLHSDTPGAPEFVRRVRDVLVQGGVDVRRMPA
ncbi:MAG: 5-oxoprolinase subunit PxpA [Phycisphaerales bacterium]